MRPLLAASLLAAALAGCATPPPVVVGGVVEAGTGGVVAAPASVSIPAIGAQSSLVPLGLNPDGTLAVPPITDPGQASWYVDGNAGVIPGQDGPALISGHRSGRDGEGRSVPGVFARLDELTPGDAVHTVDTDGQILRWQVQRVEVYPKDALNWAEVAGDTEGPELRLLTCEGLLQGDGQGGRTYDSNLVIFAVPS